MAWVKNPILFGGLVINSTRKGHQNVYGIFLALYGGNVLKLYFEELNHIFLLHFGIIKSRFHYFRSPKLQISWFLNVLTHHRAPQPTLCIPGETRTPWKYQENLGTSWQKYYLYKSDTQQFRKFRTMCAPNFFESLKFRNLKFWKLST